MRDLKAKYPWLKCEKTLEALEKMNKDLPAIVNIVKHQEKQNMFHRRYIAVNGLADTAIIEAIAHKFNIEI